MVVEVSEIMVRKLREAPYGDRLLLLRQITCISECTGAPRAYYVILKVNIPAFALTIIGDLPHSICSSQVLVLLFSWPSFRIPR